MYTGSVNGTLALACWRRLLRYSKGGYSFGLKVAFAIFLSWTALVGDGGLFFAVGIEGLDRGYLDVDEHVLWLVMAAIARL